jgi:multidrug efflux pump subunit AcrB
MQLNATPKTIDELNRIPVKVVNGAPVLVQDVAYVRDGYQVQQNIVRQNGSRGALLTILKNGNASTLSVVNTVKSLLPGIRAAAPKDITISPLFDQSLFVTSAIGDVAIHADRAGVDPAVHPDLVDHPGSNGRDAEHHDAGRPGACRRHPGG